MGLPEYSVTFEPLDPLERHSIAGIPLREVLIDALMQVSWFKREELEQLSAAALLAHYVQWKR